MENKTKQLRHGKDCTACGACKNICPIECISFAEDEEGFLYPIVDEKRCVKCGMCFETCNFSVNDIKKCNESKAYVAYSMNDNTRIQSSSGGMFSEIAHIIFSKGGHVYGAAWGADCTEVYHTCVYDEREIKKLQGSKYLQSNILNSYRKVYEDLGNELYVLFSGTPCQVAGLYKFLKKDYEKLVTCSVICHGVPSPMVWKRHVRYMEGRKSEKLTEISFRDKSSGGWKNFQLKYVFDEYKEYFKQNEDLFFRGFLENLILRPSCYECSGSWKSDTADIVLGDFWGIENILPSVNHYGGVSAVITNTRKGEMVSRLAFKNCKYSEVELTDIYSFNPVLRNHVEKNKNRDRFFSDLKFTGDIEEALNNNLQWMPTVDDRQNALYPIVYKYLNNMLEGKSIAETLERWNVHTVALYANTELMQIIIKELINDSSDIKIYLSDRNYNKLKTDMKDYECISPHNLVNMLNDEVVDIVIVCSLFHENEIINQFVDDGINLNRIISAVDVIYNTDMRN